MKKLIAKIKTKKQFTKVLVMINNIAGLFFLEQSYLLAFFGNYEIAEELSKTVCTEMLGVTLVYCLKAFFETDFEVKRKIEEQKLNTVDGVNPEEERSNDL